MYRKWTSVGTPRGMSHVSSEDVLLDGRNIHVAFKAEEPGLGGPEAA